MLSMETKNIGLRGIEIADTKISNIDGGLSFYDVYLDSSSLINQSIKKSFRKS